MNMRLKILTSPRIKSVQRVGIRMREFDSCETPWFDTIKLFGLVDWHKKAEISFFINNSIGQVDDGRP